MSDRDNYWGASGGEQNGQRMINVNGKRVSEDELRRMAANNEIASGPGGSSLQRAIDSGTYNAPGQNTARSTGDASGSVSPNQHYATSSAGTAPTGNTAANDPGYIGVQPTGGQLSEADQRRQSIYGMRQGENISNWASRAFEGATAGTGMSPNSAANPMADSPLARFFQQRYGNVLPQNSLLNMILNGPSAGVDPTVGLETSIGQGVKTGAGLGTPSNYQSMFADLANMVGRGSNNDFGGLNDFQEGMTRQLMNDPNSVVQLLSAALQGTTGGFGMQYMNNMLSDAARQSYNDPYANPSAPFLSNMLKKLGWTA